MMWLKNEKGNEKIDMNLILMGRETLILIGMIGIS